MLHGWLSDHGIYDTIMPWFDPAKYTIARMDYRGYGLSRGMKGDYSIAEIAGDALGLAERLGWNSFHVLGHSMGGMVVQKMALTAPDKIMSGIAVTPVPASGFEMDEGTRTFFESSADDDAALAEIFNILTGQRHAPAVLEALTRSARSATTRAAYLGYLAAWTQTDFAADAAQIKMPVAIIAGAKDGALGPEVMEKTYMKQLGNAHLKIIEAAGHYPMLETPPEFFGLIEAALE
jgi:pimeloyl-ACP methyl ester carboxylesterase